LFGWSQYSKVLDHAAGHHADIEVGKSNCDQTAPGKQHVAFIQEAGFLPRAMAPAIGDST